MSSNSKYHVATVINYCTNEYRFIHKCINNVSLFSSQIIVAVCNSFFDGKPENRYLLNRTYEENPDALFIEFQYDENLFMRNGAHFPHNLARWIGYKYLNSDIEYILFIDADEIVDGALFKKWLDQDIFINLAAMTFRSYWYFRKSFYRARQTETLGVLISRNSITKTKMFHNRERNAMLQTPAGLVFPYEGEPFFHHFSWVRTKKEMLRKVSSWGHKNDRNWVELVEQEFTGTFSGRDFVHGYDYDIVKSFMDIDMSDYLFDWSAAVRDFINRIYLTRKDVNSMLPFSVRWGFLPDVPVAISVRGVIRRTPFLGDCIKFFKTKLFVK